MIEVPPPETRLAFILHPRLQFCYNDLAFRPGKVLVPVPVRAQHDVGPQERFALPLNRIVKCRVPGVELEAGLAAEALAGRLELGAWEGGDGFARNGAGEGVSEVALAAALAVAEAAVEEPGGID
jgi:hypothetical protein